MMYYQLLDDILDIGKLLVRSRRAAGISQRALADALNTSQQQIARWEATSYRAASLERVSRTMKALDVIAPSGLLAAETTAIYGPTSTTQAAAPARDLGDVAARIRAHSDTFRDLYRFVRIGVFGSFTRGDQTLDSDVDLLVETDDPGGLRFMEAAEFAEAILGRKVDLVRPETLRDRVRSRVDDEVIYVWRA